MKMLAVYMFVCYLAIGLINVITCLPTSPSIEFFENDREEDGGFHFEFQSSDEIHREETGNFEETPNEKNPTLSVIGSYGYIYDNKPYFVQYTAGKDGFKADISFGTRPTTTPSAFQPPTDDELPPIIPIISSHCLGSLCGGNAFG